MGLLGYMATGAIGGIGQAGVKMTEDQMKASSDENLMKMRVQMEEEMRNRLDENSRSRDVAGREALAGKIQTASKGLLNADVASTINAANKSSVTAEDVVNLTPEQREAYGFKSSPIDDARRAAQAAQMAGADPATMGRYDQNYQAEIASKRADTAEKTGARQFEIQMKKLDAQLASAEKVATKGENSARKDALVAVLKNNREEALKYETDILKYNSLKESALDEPTKKLHQDKIDGLEAKINSLVNESSGISKMLTGFATSGKIEEAPEPKSKPATATEKSAVDFVWDNGKLVPSSKTQGSSGKTGATQAPENPAGLLGMPEKIPNLELKAAQQELDAAKQRAKQAGGVRNVELQNSLARSIADAQAKVDRLASGK